MPVRTINPLKDQSWDDYVNSSHFSSVFHSKQWAKVLNSTYGYHPIYFSQIENSEIKCALPLMEVSSIFTGKRGVSLPFTDECHPILENGHSLNPLLDRLYAYGQKRRWRHIEFRGGEPIFDSQPPAAIYYTHTLSLKNKVEDIFSSFKSNTKRNIKKAQKIGLHISVCNSRSGMLEFRNLNEVTRKHHGLPPQPSSFFKQIYEHIISRNTGNLFMAFYDNRPISGAIFLHHKDQVVYKYGASSRHYLHLRPNNMVMWEAIKWYSENHYKEFSFGRTELENIGLRRFKRGWGTKETKLKYYKYDLKNKCFIRPPTRLKTSYNFFGRMPLPVLRIIGNLVYRHVG